MGPSTYLSYNNIKEHIPVLNQTYGRIEKQDIVAINTNTKVVIMCRTLTQARSKGVSNAVSHS